MTVSTSRRALLQAGAASLLPWLAACTGVQRLPAHPHYGPLQPVVDEATGRPLLQLPAGFRYLSFGWAGDPLADGTPTPAAHDGMAVVAVQGDVVTLVRNHELAGTAGAFAANVPTWDPLAGGGTTTLRFSTAGSGRWLDARASLAGTTFNCAGGPTPWGSWLTCEESSFGPHSGHPRTHGWVFEVPGAGTASARPLTGLGNFVHEAAAIDPATGIVYLTEDAPNGGFYRFLPAAPGRLAEGGRLQMMKLAAAPNTTVMADGQARPVFDLGVGHAPASRWDAAWVDIEDPTRQFQRAAPQPRTPGGVHAQGFAQGATSVRRGEGCWCGDGRVFFASTSGGAAKQGQVFMLDPKAQTLTLLYESPGKAALSMPDNLALSPRGGLALCEDGDNLPQYLRGLTRTGEVFPLLANHVDLSATGSGALQRPGGRRFERDFRGSELAGVSFHGDWLFFNIQRPGISFAVTGPWGQGGL